MGEHFKWNPSEERAGQMLRQAVYMEDIVTLEHLVKNKADLEARDETGATPLHIATQCKPNLISYFLTKRADVTATDGEGFSALAWACIKGHAPAVRELLRGYADGEALMASSSKTALSLCAERGHLECVTELLNWTAVETLNSDGSTLPGLKHLWYCAHVRVPQLGS